MFWGFFLSPGCSGPDMHSLRLIAVSVQLLCYLLLCPVDAASHREPTSVSTMLPPSQLGYQMPTSDPLSCQALLPKSLPGFAHMPPVSKFLVGLALRNALEEAGCQAEVRALQFHLYQLGGVKATQALIRHLQELQKGGLADRQVSVNALSSALQHLAWEQSGPKRVRRWISNKDCENEQEQRVHNVVDLLPAVGTYYNLGTALYYAIKNCSDKAKERGRDGAIDLGYDLLMAMVGASGGPGGVVITAALKPAMKAGVQRLIRYYYDEKEVITPQAEVYYYNEKEETTPQAEVYYSDEKEATTPQPEVYYSDEKEMTTHQAEVYYYNEKEATTPQAEVYYYYKREVITPQAEVYYYDEKEATTPQPEVYYYDEKEATTPQAEVYYYYKKEMTTPQAEVYYYYKREVTTPQPETGKDTTTYIDEVEETTMSNLVSEVESTTSNWEWPLLNNYDFLAYKR